MGTAPKSDTGDGLSRLLAKFDNVSAQLISKMDAVSRQLNSKMDVLSNQLLSDRRRTAELLDARLEQAIANMTKWVVGVGVALITALVALMTFMLSTALNRIAPLPPTQTQPPLNSRYEPPAPITVIILPRS